MTVVQGHRYRIKGTKSEGLVTKVNGDFAEWSQIYEDWPYPAKPVTLYAKCLERVSMRYSRGDDPDLPRSQVSPTGPGEGR